MKKKYCPHFIDENIKTEMLSNCPELHNLLKTNPRFFSSYFSAFPLQHSCPSETYSYFNMMVRCLHYILADLVNCFLASEMTIFCILTLTVKTCVPLENQVQ